MAVAYVNSVAPVDLYSGRVSDAVTVKEMKRWLLSLPPNPLLGCRGGPVFLETGYVYAPYIPRFVDYYVNAPCVPHYAEADAVDRPNKGWLLSETMGHRMKAWRLRRDVERIARAVRYGEWAAAHRYD